MRRISSLQQSDCILIPSINILPQPFLIIILMIQKENGKPRAYFKATSVILALQELTYSRATSYGADENRNYYQN